MASDRLKRNLGLWDAVVVGLAAMIGAGIFTAISPAAGVAGAGLLIGLVIAASVAFLNGSSSAQLARLYPTSGGTYIFAKKRLNDFWAWLTGWSFIIGKTTSCTVAALAFGQYLAPHYAHYCAALAVAAFTVLNYFGIKKTAVATWIILSLVLVALITIVIFALSSQPNLNNLQPLVGKNGLYGILQSAGILFFAFAGYSRIATLAEEVKKPERTIPRAIIIGLVLTLILYVSVAVSALLTIGASNISHSSTPLLQVMARSGQHLKWVVRVGALLATLGALLSLMTGVSRTIFAMASDRNLPTSLKAVHPKFKVPHHAELTVGVILVILVLLTDLRAAISFSAFATLLYYAITNAAAYTLGTGERLFSHKLPIIGFLGCILLALTLPIKAVVIGALVAAFISLIYVIKNYVFKKHAVDIAK